MKTTKAKINSLRHRIFIIYFCTAVLSSCCWARSVYTLYSDEGISGLNFDAWGEWGVGAKVEDSNTCPGGNPEGYKCMMTTCPPGGWGAGYGVRSGEMLNLSAYAGGRLRFWVYSSTGDCKIEMEDYNGVNQQLWLYNCGWDESANRNQWTLIDIPISSFTSVNLGIIKYPFKFVMDHENNCAYTDLVRMTTGVALNTVYAELADRGTHGTVGVTSATWAPVIPSTWNAAENYVKIDYDPGVLSWHIRMYTDNKEAGANPRYAGTQSDCSGLVCSTAAVTAETPLRVSWTVEDTTKTPSQLGCGTPGDCVSGGNSFKWIKDKNQGTLDTADLGYASPWTNQGILCGTWDSGTSATRVWKNSPNFIYLGADFEYAKPGRKYRTSRLLFELYYE